MIVLFGFMGAGKTSIGKLVARRTGLPFIDTDAEVQRRAGKSISQIFEQDGEGAFRSMEREVVANALEGPESVIALGGGAVIDPATRSAIEWAKHRFYLKVSFGDAMKRAGDGTRPLLQKGDSRALYGDRLRVYERIPATPIDTTGRDPEGVAAEIAAALGHADTGAGDANTVAVPLGARSYDVIVGDGLWRRLGSILPKILEAETAFVVTHERLDVTHVATALRERGLKVETTVVPEGEASKSLEQAGGLYDWLASASAHRKDLLVGIGGGVITDLVGFVASTYNRGMPVAYLPTTLLGQVDAAIGGKTGLNLTFGKNLVGTVHQPVVVVCDTSILTTLPDAELRSGMAEVVKYGLISDPGLLEVVRNGGDKLQAREPGWLIEVVTRSAEIKAGFVAGDERESGIRAHLNYGHTFAHAIERNAGFVGIRHGEAVALGMMAAAYLAHDMGRIDEELVRLHRDVLAEVGLPISADLDLADLEEGWLRDKKFAGEVSFVLLAGLGEPESGVKAPRSSLIAAVGRMKE